MNDIFNIPVDINKNNNKNKESGKDRHKNIHITVRFSPEEYEYFTSMISILYNIKINSRPVLDNTDMGFPSFCKVALRYFCNNFKDNVFSNNDIVTHIDIDDMETFQKLIGFRVKYMNYPLNKQIEDLKREGYLK